MERFETVMTELKRLEEEYKIADKRVEDYWEGEGEDEDYEGLVKAYREAKDAYEAYLKKTQEELDKEGRDAMMREEAEVAKWYAGEARYAVADEDGNTVLRTNDIPDVYKLLNSEDKAWSVFELGDDGEYHISEDW